MGILQQRLSIFFCLLNSYYFSSAATLLTGDNGTSSTFTFSIGSAMASYGLSSELAGITIGAGEQKTGNTYSIAQYTLAAGKFIPLAVSQVTLNNVKNQTDPLTGKKIKFLCGHVGVDYTYVPFTVIDFSGQMQQERFYSFPEVNANLTDLTQTQVAVVSSDVPADAAGVAAGAIQAITSGVVNNLATGESSSKEVVFGAVSSSGSAFGSSNSGICMARLERTANGPSPKGFNYFLRLFNLTTGSAGNKSVALNQSTPAVMIGSACTFDTTVVPVVDLWWDGALQRLYIAVRVTAAGGSDNGARALIVGRIVNGILYLDKFVPDAAITASSNDRLVGAVNGGSASIYKVRTMHTSTGLSYAIINGGNGALNSVANRVYAVPLVDERNIQTNWATAQVQGTAADATSIPQTVYTDVYHRFKSRSFSTAATSAAQLLSSSDRAAYVGAGTLPFINGSSKVISDMQVYSDAVYVCVPYDYASSGGQVQQPGVFQSRAIFDNYGRIAAWTPWVRVTGSASLMYHSFLDSSNGSFVFTTGASSSQVYDVKKTVWGTDEKDGLLGGTSTDASVGLINVLARVFQGNNGGIQAAKTFDATVNAVSLPHSGLTGTDILLAAGKNMFALAKTGDDNGIAGTIKPFVGDFANGLVSSANGTFPSGSGRVFTVSGGALSSVGPATTVSVFSNATRSWIAVGGVNGVVILSDAQGQGFLPSSLPLGFTFKKVGDYHFVQKIIGDGTYLYILTSQGLERVVIDPSTFVSGTLNRTVVASPSQLGLGACGSLCDVVIGEKLALLATNKGLYRIANNNSIKVGRPAWVPVVFNESPGPVYSLSIIGSQADVGQSFLTGAQLFALAAYRGYQQACLYRLYILEGSQVSDSSVQMIGDLFVQGLPSYFASFGQFRAAYADDGSVRLAVRPVDPCRTLALYALPAYMRVGLTHFPTAYCTNIAADLPPCAQMGMPLRSDASGAWLLYGSFGLRVNE